MPVMDSNEMEVFSFAHARLVAKAREAGKDLSPEEIAKRMLIVQASGEHDPEVFEQRVFAEPFPDPQKNSAAHFLWDPMHFR
jgi:hypothetical protein